MFEHEQPNHENSPHQNREPHLVDLERPHLAMPSSILRSYVTPVALTIAAIALLVYGLHERSVAAHYSAQSGEAAAQTKELRAQVGTLTAKLDSLANANSQPQPPAQTAPTIAPSRRSVAPLHPTGSRQKPDPRWKKMQSQLDAQGKAIEDTQQQLASTRTDLEGSIARTHDELVVLQKKGERNYYEFDLDKTKHFQTVGGMGISLRKANTKHQYADLELLVDDRELSKKHLNLYEPAMFYPGGERQAVELVVIGITKNHVHGYISAPKYRASELASASASASTPDSKDAQQSASDKSRQKLAVPR